MMLTLLIANHGRYKCAYFFELRKAVIILEESEVSENGMAIAPERGRLRVLGEPRLKKIKAELVFSEAHLDHAIRVVGLVVRVLLVLFPP